MLYLKKHSIKKYFLFTIILSSIVFFYSCQPDDDLNPSSIEGTWNCSEISTMYGQQTYVITISSDQSPPNYYCFYNLYSIKDDVYGSLNGFTITIATQTTQTGYKISGKGTVANDYKTIDFTLSVNDGSSSQNDQVTITCTKR